MCDVPLTMCECPSNTMPEEKLIFTVGTSNRSAEEFLSLLRSFHIEAVVDVRRFPSSKFAHFSRQNLADILSQAGIAYFYLGSGLGGFRKGGYKSFTETGEFRAGIEKLKQIADQKRTAFMCAERFPWRCHRRFIAIEMEKEGWRVEHILDPGKSWTPARSNEARLS